MSATTTSWFVPVRHLAPDDLELWLEKKAAEGKIANHMSTLSSVRMTFDITEPATYRYALERRDRPIPSHYYSAREDMGWQHVGHLGGVQVWRREYSDTRPAGFIGEDLGRRAALVGVGVGAVAVLALICAVVLGIVSGLTDGSSAATKDLWIAAIVFSVIAAGTGLTALVFGLSKRSASNAAEPRREKVDA